MMNASTFQICYDGKVYFFCRSIELTLLNLLVYDSVDQNQSFASGSS